MKMKVAQSSLAHCGDYPDNDTRTSGDTDFCNFLMGMTSTDINGSGDSHGTDDAPQIMTDLEEMGGLSGGDEEEEEGESITELPVSLNPLQHDWSFWYLKNDRTRSWTERLTRVKSVGTVEEFWAVINFTTQASKIPVGCEYYLFKSHIRPMWEDPANRLGGRWVTILEKTMRYVRLDHYWLETLLLLIGEGFSDYSDSVCGAVVQLRGKGDKLSIWTSRCDDEEMVRNIGRCWKERLQLTIPISYQRHEDQQAKSSSMPKSLYSL